MIPRDRLERIPIPAPELAGYLVDSEGQVWRAGGTQGGRDRPLRAMRFVDAIRGWEQRGDRVSDRVVQLMPGVWRWCRGGHPEGLEWNTWGHTDSRGFFMRYAYGISIGGPRPWPKWSEAEFQATQECDKFASRPSWFGIRLPSLLPDSLLLAGPVVFVASLRNSAGGT